MYVVGVFGFWGVVVGWVFICIVVVDWVIVGGWVPLVVAVVSIIVIWVSGCLFGLLVLRISVPSLVVVDWVSGIVSQWWVVFWLGGVFGCSVMRSPGW